MKICPDCQNQFPDAYAECPLCVHAERRSYTQIAPLQTNARNLPSAPPKKIIDKTRAWCPHCKNRNSYRATSGVGCLTLGVMFISILGIFLIPFLPKSWHCRVCKHTWR